MNKDHSNDQTPDTNVMPNPPPNVVPTGDKANNKSKNVNNTETKKTFVRGSASRLKLRAEIMRKRLAELEFEAKARTRKASNRIKVLVGIATLQALPQDKVTEILNKNIQNPRDRAFLAEQGYPIQAAPHSQSSHGNE